MLKRVHSSEWRRESSPNLTSLSQHSCGCSHRNARDRRARRAEFSRRDKLLLIVNAFCLETRADSDETKCTPMMESPSKQDYLHLAINSPPAAASSPQLTEVSGSPSNPHIRILEHIRHKIDSVINTLFGEDVISVNGLLIISTHSHGELRVPINRFHLGSPLNSSFSPGVSGPQDLVIASRSKRKNPNPMKIETGDETSGMNLSIRSSETASSHSFPSPCQDSPLDLCLGPKPKPSVLAEMALPPPPLSFPFSFLPMFKPSVPLQRPLLSPEFLASQLARSPDTAKSSLKMKRRSAAGGARCRRNGSSKSFRCNQCSTTFPSLAVLSKHTYSTHSAFRCMICGSNFTQRSNLQRHSLKHVGFKPFICNICAREYYRKDHLVRHIELTHPGHDPRSNITSKLSSSESLDYLDRRDGRLATSPVSSCNEERVESDGPHSSCNAKDIETSHDFDVKTETSIDVCT